MEPIRSHDGLFRFVFGEPEQMAELLRGALPPPLAAAIHWQTLRRLPDTYVDMNLEARAGDLFFAAELGGTTLLLQVLVEHKAKVERFTALQQTGYTVRLLEHWRTENPGARTLPAVVTCVLYHGDTAWNAPTSVHELVDTTGWNDTLRDQLLARQLRQPFVLVDLSHLDEDQLDALWPAAIPRLALRFLQFLRGLRLPEAIATIRSWRQIVTTVQRHPRGVEVLAALCSWYLGRDPEHPETLRTVMAKLGEEDQPMRTMLDLVLEMGEERGVDRGRQEGRQEGRQVGRQEGRQEGVLAVLLSQLEARFGQLPADVHDRIARAELATLQRWSLRVLTARNLDEALVD